MPGTYNLTVTASNEISHTSTHTLTTLREPITSLVLSSSPVLHGLNPTIFFRVGGGPEFSFSVDFGDGTAAEVTSDSPDVSVESIDHFHPASNVHLRFDETLRRPGWICSCCNSFQRCFRHRWLYSGESGREDHWAYDRNSKFVAGQCRWQHHRRGHCWYWQRHCFHVGFQWYDRTYNGHSQVWTEAEMLLYFGQGASLQFQ